MFVVPLELCVKCYAFVFKSERLRPSHISYHITVVITNLKKKNLLRQKPLLTYKVFVRNDCFSAKGRVFPRQ